LSYLANTQTDRQINKVWQKHYLLGRGKNSGTFQDFPGLSKRFSRTFSEPNNV